MNSLKYKLRLQFILGAKRRNIAMFFSDYITQKSIATLHQTRFVCSVLHLPALAGPVKVMSRARESSSSSILTLITAAAAAAAAVVEPQSRDR